MIRFSTRPAKPIRRKTLTGGPKRRRNYGATRLGTIANAGPTSQWVNRVSGELEYPLEDSYVKTYALPTKFVPIAGHLPACFWQQLLTAVLGSHP